jgi:hypothetical protein
MRKLGRAIRVAVLLASVVLSTGLAASWVRSYRVRDDWRAIAPRGVARVITSGGVVFADVAGYRERAFAAYDVRHVTDAPFDGPARYDPPPLVRVVWNRGPFVLVTHRDGASVDVFVMLPHGVPFLVTASPGAWWFVRRWRRRDVATGQGFEVRVDGSPK